MNRSPNRLREVWVRSLGPDKERRWKALLRINRHLGFGNCCGHRLRQVAVQRGSRLALLDWHAATLHFGARDCWIGRTRPQRRERQCRLCNQLGFLMLSEASGTPCMAIESWGSA